MYDLTGGMAAEGGSQLCKAVLLTGVVVYDREYYIGSGAVCFDTPGCTPFGKPVRSFDIGSTEFPKEVFESWL